MKIPRGFPHDLHHEMMEGTFSPMLLSLVTPVVSTLGISVFRNLNHDWIHLRSIIATVQPVQHNIALLENCQGELVAIENPCISDLKLPLATDLDEQIALNVEGAP